MNATKTETIQQLALDGPISVPTVAVLALLLVSVFAWSLYQERKILGVGMTWWFGVLRVITVATVLWMLLSPTNVIVQTQSTRRAIAIVTDTSASMRKIDPPGTADELRWMIAQDKDEYAVELADRAVAAIRMANQELLAAISSINDHQGEAKVIDHMVATRGAFARVKQHLEAIRDDHPASNGSVGETMESIESIVRRARRLISSPEIEAFVDLSTVLEKGKTPVDSTWRESLPDLGHRIDGLQNVISELARVLSFSDRMQPGHGKPSINKDFANSSRLKRVSNFLDQLNRGTLSKLTEKADIRWSRFDENAIEINPDDSLRRSLGLEVQGATTNDDVTVTNVSSALVRLRQMEKQQPIAAAFILSDVAHNDTGQRKTESEETSEVGGSVEGSILKEVREPVEVAQTMGSAPIYVVPIGNPNRLRDVDLVSVEAPPVVMRNDEIVIEAYVQAYQCDGERCVVQLMDGVEVVDFREVELDSPFVSRTVRFQRRVSEIGNQVFQIAIPPIDGETTDENNFNEVSVNVTRSDIKVLLADEMPRWEYRYLAQLFRRDPKVDCDEMLFRPRLIATGRREETRTFPESVDDWDQYDVVILGDLSVERLTVAAKESLIKYLRKRGGTLVTIAGPRAMPHAYQKSPLESVIPVRSIDPVEALSEKEYAFRVTKRGYSHIALMIGDTQQATRDAWAFVNQFTPLHDVSRWRKPKPAAQNLIAAVPRGAEVDDAEDSSFLCWQRVGRGRVVYLAGPDTYRLRFLRGDLYHFRFWGQMLRWAIASDLGSGNKYVRVRTNKSRYDTGESIRIETELFDIDGQPLTGVVDSFLQLTSGEETKTLAMQEDTEATGRYIAEIPSAIPGVYTAVPSGPTIKRLQRDETSESSSISFTVNANLPMELVDTRCNHVLARQIAQSTGGQVLPPTAIEEVLRLTNLEPVVTETIQRTPIWAKWRYLWIVFGCLQIEWIIRKWRGLS